jgi:hypothetical protein
VFKEMMSLYQVYGNDPNFGVESSIESEAPSLEHLLQPKVIEDTNVMEEQEDTQAIAAFYAQTGQLEDEHRFEHIQYDAKLGLAVEGLGNGITLEQLWRVI